MKYEDLMKLVNAGFTKAEIQAMVSAEQPAPEQAPAPEPEPEPAPAPAPAPAPEPNYNQAIQQLTDQVSQLTNLVQRSNLLRMEQPEVKQESAEDIIASIIYPTFKGDNK